MSEQINILIEKKHQLIRKIDGSYKSQQVKELDLAELSKLSERIRDLTYARIKGQRVKLVKKLDKTHTIKDIRKIYNAKYDSICEQTTAARSFVDDCVKEKAYLRDLKAKFDVIARKHKLGKKLSEVDRKVNEDILGW